MFKYIIISTVLLFSGCINMTTIDPVKSWEGHFMTVDDFKKATNDITLDDDESIWVLSDRTLNRVLKNTER